MTIQQSSPRTDAEVTAALRALLAQRLHAAVDGLVDELATDVLVALLAPELVVPQSNGQP